MYKYMYVISMYICIQVHLNKLECRGKVHLFHNSTQIVQTRVLHKFNAHRLK